MDRRWYYRTDAGAVGPLGPAELAGLVRAGTLTPDTPLSLDGTEAWAPAGERLPDLTEAPPPVRDAERPAAGPPRGWTDTTPRPWRRYFARLTDNLLIGAVLWMALAVVAYLVDPRATERAFALLSHPAAGLVEAMLTLALVLPAQVLMIGLTGLTPGKWIFGVRVLRDGRPIGVPAAIVRELGVWTRGLGLGAPIVTLVTLATSYAHLVRRGAAPWDARNLVVHRPVNVLQVLLLLLAVPALLTVFVGLKLAGAK